MLATLRNRKRQTQDSNPRFTAPTEIRRKHRPQMDASDDFVTLSQARTRRSWLKEFRRSAQRQNKGTTTSKKASGKKGVAPKKSSGRPPMSAEARKKRSELAKQRWAQRRNKA